jgi:two-component system, chemotaxis family, CheB/CheR fusion protein
MKKKIHLDFPIIGIGASAGGLSAFESFFASFPIDSTIETSFVLVQHLSPDHKSMLSDIISHYTHMTVQEVQNNMPVLSNCIYTIPPNYDMSIRDGKFTLTDPLQDHGHRLPIDFFFNSLAEEMQNMAICIVLSGAGNDGSEGVKNIKKHGGLVIAQSLESSEFDSMPRNAIETGVVDYKLRTSDMGKTIIHYIKSSIFHKEDSTVHDQTYLEQIFTLLNKSVGHDFSLYKRSTIDRRIQKRMDAHKLNSLKKYVNILSNNRDELVALYNEILIGVTNFFRDSEAFKSLELNILPKLFNHSDVDAKIRIWVAGCSTGEEAYSIAIVLQEYITKHKIKKSVQIFASDIDERAITKARKGLFSESIKDNISSQRLKDFFSQKRDKS